MTNKQLRSLMKRRNLSIQGVADLTKVSPATVRAWLRPKTSKAHRNMTKRSESVLRGCTAGEDKGAPTSTEPDASVPMAIPPFVACTLQPPTGPIAAIAGAGAGAH